MHYYPRRLGDYSTATTHLSMLEHGAFTKLLDYYYSTEKPLPVDRCERIAGAYEPHEREAVQSVLQQFFRLSDQGWVNAKADEVIAQFRSKSLKAKESAERRWKRTDSDGNANAYADAMLTQNSKPITQKEEQKATVQPTAAPRSTAVHFDRFWAAYPNKKGKKDAERHWRREGCDDVADSLIAHVRMMMAQDDGWRRGYAPMGSTYLNGRRWEDIPLGPPKDRLSKSAQALIALEGMKNGMDGSGNQNGFPEIDLPRIGSTARIGTFGGNGNGMG